jgi:hypothetical protein
MKLIGDLKEKVENAKKEAKELKDEQTLKK